MSDHRCDVCGERATHNCGTATATPTHYCDDHMPGWAELGEALEAAVRGFQ